MKTMFTTISLRARQSGYASVLAALILAMVVLIILMQSVQMSGTKALETQQHLDSVQALALAESGMEIAVGKVTNQYNTTTDLTGSCGTGGLGTLPSSAQNLGTSAGTFTFVSAVPDSGGTYCKIRVRGTVGSANRTIETWLGFSTEFGVGGFGTAPTLTLNNTLGVPALAIFDLAWAVKGSDGTDARSTDPNLNNNSYCYDCNVGQIWYGAKPGNGYAGAGTWQTVTATSGSTATYSRHLDYNRNYIMVGMMMGGLGGTSAAYVGGYQFINASTQAWVNADSSPAGCTDENVSALVLGISAKGYGTSGNTLPPNYSASFDTADLNGIITTGTLPGQWRRLIHYPSTTGGTPSDSTGYAPMGDIFSEIFYVYKGLPVTVSGANGSKNDNFFTVSSVTDLNVGDYIRASGSTAIKDFTKIVSINSTTNTVTINTTLNSKLNNDKICSGLCGIMPRDPTAAKLTLGGTSSVFKGLTAGIACIKNVDNTKVKVLTSTSSHRIIQWHEVLSNE